MSLNLGNEAIAAAKSLHDNPGARDDFDVVRQAVADQCTRAMDAAMNAEPAAQSGMLGYARGLRDLYTALEGGVNGVNPNRVEKPAAVQSQARR